MNTGSCVKRLFIYILRGVLIISIVLKLNQGKDVILEDKDGCLRCISHCQDNCGYTRIKIKGKHERLFRVLYENQYGKIPEGMLLRHLCNNSWCCNTDHLKIGTYKENYQDMIDCGRGLIGKPNIKIRGKNNSQSKLNEQQVVEIRNSKLSNKQLAVIYGVSHITISNVKNKKYWGYVD